VNGIDTYSALSTDDGEELLPLLKPVTNSDFIQSAAYCYHQPLLRDNIIIINLPM
jgi:hypothetical protein